MATNLKVGDKVKIEGEFTVTVTTEWHGPNTVEVFLPGVGWVRPAALTVIRPSIMEQFRALEVGTTYRHSNDKDNVADRVKLNQDEYVYLHNRNASHQGSQSTVYNVNNPEHYYQWGATADIVVISTPTKHGWVNYNQSINRSDDAIIHDEDWTVVFDNTPNEEAQ